MHARAIKLSVAWLFCSLLPLLGSAVFAADALLAFDTPAQADHYQQLTEELRCLKCQNQNIADSRADLANDLKTEIHRMVVAGMSTEDIKAFMVERYGDFVLYKPRFSGANLLLWAGPLLLLLTGIAVIWRLVRGSQSRAKQSAATDSDVDPASLEKARSYLK